MKECRYTTPPVIALMKRFTKAQERICEMKNTPLFFLQAAYRHNKKLTNRLKGEIFLIRHVDSNHEKQNQN